MLVSQSGHHSSSFSGALFLLARSVYKNAFVIWNIVRRDVVMRYQSTFLGVFWSLLNPLAYLSIYSIVFGGFFKVRFPSINSAWDHPYGIVLFSGLLMHIFFAESITRSNGIVLDNRNYVTRVVFPLEILPLTVLLSNLVHAVIGIFVLLAAMVVTSGGIPLTALLLPIVWLPFLVLTLGISMFLASFGVFVRDTGQLLGFIVTILLFSSPVLFPTSSLPDYVQNLIVLNPLTIPVQETRAVLLWGNLPNWGQLLGYTVAAVFTLWAGAGWFFRTRKGFADVI